MKYNISLVNIDEIIAGDTVMHNDKMMTVSNSDIKQSSFMGTSLFGDSYNHGHKLVKKVIIEKA